MKHHNLTHDKNVTLFKFKKWSDGSIIVFMLDTANITKNELMSYEHIGQHGLASLDLLDELQDATPNEYAELLKELTNIIGYTNYKVI